jgi:ABC-type multidrug transport system ATPase subunit
MSDAALEVRGLRRTYPRGRVAVDNLDLTVTVGSVYGFLGPNGAGKTTAMRCILGLIRRDAGSVAIFGDMHPVKQRQHVGAIIETPTFYDWMNAKANLEISCAYAGIPTAGNVERALARVGLTKRQTTPVRGFSLGMKQRLAIARCLLTNPKLLILDEPTNGLDPAGVKEMRDLIVSLAQDDGITILISSHILKEVEAVATRVGIIQDGRLVAEGDVDELLASAGVQIEVASPDDAKLREVLAFTKGVSIVGPGENGLLVKLEDLQPHELNTQLVTAGVPVSYLGAGRNLEDVFLALTGTGGQIQ